MRVLSKITAIITLAFNLARYELVVTQGNELVFRGIVY